MKGAKRHERRLQSAMEYLMTYGWAILIIAVVLGALFQLGVFNSSSFSPRAPPGACQVFRPSGPGTTTNINLMGVCTGQLPQYVGQFNGAGSYADVPNSAKWFSDPLSVSVWFSAANLSSAVAVLGTFYNGNNWMLYRNGNYPLQRLAVISYYNKVGGGTNYLFAYYDGFRNNALYNVVFVRNASASTATIKMYVNGALQSTSTYSDFLSWVLDTTQGVRIGGNAVGGGYPFNGQVANVQMYNTSLSANQVQAIYLGGIGGAPMKLQNLIGWWPLNGDTKDYSGNNNNGVPTAVTFTSQYGK